MIPKFAIRLSLACLVLAIPATRVIAQELLDAAAHPKFVNPLPIPARVDATRGGSYEVQMRETTQWLGLVDATGKPLSTRVWGYGLVPGSGGGGGGVGKGQVAVTYPGPTFVAARDVPLNVLWQNNLPQKHLLPIDTTVHWANPSRGGIAAVTHLHGGHTESASDGLPEAWFTQRFRETGPDFVKQTYHYDNDQEAATLWYHDHALGITRLNVYAGLAGFYLLRDANESGLTASAVLPGGAYEIEIVFQDRMFTRSGQLFYPAADEALPPGGPRPSVLPEFFGDFILVNGAAWPVLDVEPRKYRFRTLNGSDSRFYVIELRNAMDMPQSFLQIGTDGGLLDQPVELTRLVLAPGERADLVVNFASLPMGSRVTVANFGPDSPFKELPVAPDEAADPATTGRLLQFRVALPLSSVPDASVETTTPLRQERVPSLRPTGATRQLLLFEGEDEYGRLQPILGTTEAGQLGWHDPITENPGLNDVEIWEVYNTTEDAHPIHLHLVTFQILDRRAFTADQDPESAALTNIRLVGPPLKPADNENGWKDTAQMLPGQVTRVIAKFDREGLYVWHCHILSHEDHEMMRPYYVGPMPMAPQAKPALPFALGQNEPNPFNPMTSIRFRLPTAGPVELRIHDAAGRLVRRLAQGRFAAGEHELRWDGRNDAGRNMASGVYFYRLQAGELLQTRQMVLLR